MSQTSFADEVKGPWSRRQGVALDVAVVAALLLAVLIGLLTDSRGRGPAMVAAGFSSLQVLPLLVRRVRPLWCLTLVAALSLAQLPFTDFAGWGQLAVPVTVYSAAAYGSRVVGRAALATGLLGSLIGPLDWALGSSGGTDVLLTGGLICGLVVITSWAVGMLGRTRRAYVVQLVERGIRLERETAQQAELAASEERARIAREMHDVVAHGISVMVVQADGARYQLEQDPVRAGRALETIASTGRESLQEMRRMLGLLRTGDAPSGTRPQPGLEDLRFLLDQDLGEQIRLEADLPDHLPAVSQGVGLAAYRIVQESLTNVLKHAGPQTRVTVEVRAEHGRIDLAVRDDGRGAAVPDDGHGHGIIGMQERAALHDGTLMVGPHRGGGFEVRASLPYAEVTADDASVHP